MAPGETGSASCCRSRNRSPACRSGSASSSTPGTTGRRADIDDTIALVGLTDKADAVAGQLSGGQRRRLDVALALIGDPDIVFLDEPTTGFDPSARRAAWEVIAGLRELGKTIFLTTHYMDEAEYLADRIAVIADGRIVAEGTPKTLGGRDRMTATIRFTLPSGLAARDLPAGLRPLAEAGPDGTTLLRSESPLVHVQTLADWALGPGRRPSRPRRPPPHPRRRLPHPHRPDRKGPPMIAPSLSRTHDTTRRAPSP